MFFKLLIQLICYCSTAIGIRGKDGVVFAVEKLVQSKLYERGSNKRIFTVDKHIGMVSTELENYHKLLIILDKE